MKVLFIGGTGNISSACTDAALKKGFEVFHLNRGTHAELKAEGVVTLKADINDTETVRMLTAGLHFDSIVQWIGYTALDMKRDIELFRGKTAQYVFISSASAYQKPSRSYIITESTPLINPYWQYSRDKTACEQVLTEAYAKEGFPMTIVRPSHTYGEGWIPTPFGSSEFTVPQRMLDGKEIIVPGDGQSLWTVTHTTDFAKGLVGLLCNDKAIGEAFHITSDEALTWDTIHRIIAEALGVTPKIVHIPSDYIASLFPEHTGNLLGDKSNSVVFDNTKIKRAVPDFICSTPFSVGVRRSIEWLEAHPEKKVVNQKMNEQIEAILKAFKKA